MFTLDQTVPWGRNLDEYRRMFALAPSDVDRRILGCADGPASFNAELTAANPNARVVSCDPLYQFSKREIASRIDECFDLVMDQTRKNAHEFVWGSVIQSPDSLARTRRAAMDAFLADYDAGKTSGRYLVGTLPDLPFADAAFDLALCSHFLFLYSQQHDADFHVAALRELARVAVEVRVFPLLELGSRPSRHLDAVLAALPAFGLTPTVEPVDYEFQRGGDHLLRIRPSDLG